jgi:hypothetical protein
LGAGQLTLVNQAGGTIDGSGTANALTLDTGSGSFSNAGIIEATGAGGLAILNSTGTNTGTIEGLTNSTLTIQNSTIDNTGGNVNATGAGAIVALANGAIIDNGTLATSGGGTIKTLFGSNSTIDKAKINNASNLVVGDNSTLTLGSTVNNTGTLSIASAGNNADLIIDANGATLQGKGNVTLTDKASNRIYGAAAADTLTNVDNTISGAGQLGAGQLTLVNQAGGTIDGSGTANALTLDTGSGSFSMPASSRRPAPAVSPSSTAPGPIPAPSRA